MRKEQLKQVRRITEFELVFDSFVFELMNRCHRYLRRLALRGAWWWPPGCRNFPTYETFACRRVFQKSVWPPSSSCIGLTASGFSTPSSTVSLKRFSSFSSFSWPHSSHSSHSWFGNGQFNCNPGNVYLSFNRWQVQTFLLHFWQGMPPHLMGVLGSNVVVNIVGICDSILYRSVCSILMSSIIRVIHPSISIQFRLVEPRNGFEDHDWFVSSLIL